jgi:hypothetical protein
MYGLGLCCSRHYLYLAQPSTTVENDSINVFDFTLWTVDFSVHCRGQALGYESLVY